jgi:membrane dipeptidase
MIGHLSEGKAKTNMTMNRRALLAGATMAGLAAATPSLARKKRRLVINGLGGLGDPNGGEFGEKEIAAHYLDPRPIADARAAGLAATNVTLGYVYGDDDPFVLTIEDIAWWDEAIRLRPDRLLKILTAEDIRAAHTKNLAGIIYGFQSSEMFAGDADRASIFADLGVRACQLTYNLRSAAGDGALVEENSGLTDFGRDLVAALNEECLLVDLSHGGEKTTMDAIAASKAPIAITHTGCAALAPHPRNRGDAELRALADKGGVMGVYFMPYLSPGRQHRAADIVAHIEHAVNVCGEDHVGIGTDGGATAIDDMPAYLDEHRKDVENRKKLGVGAPNEDPDIILIPPDLMGPTQFEKLSGLLAARGHKEARIEKILGGNFLRLFEEVWGG